MGRLPVQGTSQANRLRVLQGTLVFNRNATLYRAVVGSIRTVRDYVEGGWGLEACRPPVPGLHGLALPRSRN